MVMRAKDAKLEAIKFQRDNEKFQAIYAEIDKGIREEASEGSIEYRYPLKQLSHGQILLISDTLKYERGYKCEIDFSTLVIRW